MVDDGVKFDQIIQPSINNSEIIIRHNFEKVGGVLQYRMEVNPNLKGLYHECLGDSTEISSEVVDKLPLTFSERLFIQFGKNI